MKAHHLKHADREILKEKVKQNTHLPSDISSFHDIPGLVGIGIADDKVVIHVNKNLHHTAIYNIPKNVSGVPVNIKYVEPHRHHVKQNYRAFASNMALQGGDKIVNGSSACTLTGVFTDGTKNYIMSCAHCWGISPGSQVLGGLGTVTKSALYCGQSDNHLDATIAQTNLSPSGIKGMNGLPAGIVDPQVGQTVTFSGAFSGVKNAKVTAVNFDMKDTYPEINSNCPVMHKDLYVTEGFGVDGDSGAPCFIGNQLVGIHFDGSGDIGHNCKASYISSELGVHLPGSGTIPINTTADTHIDMNAIYLLAGAGLLLWVLTEA